MKRVDWKSEFSFTDTSLPKPKPTMAEPGSDEKILELQRRLAAGQELFHENDATQGSATEDLKWAAAECDEFWLGTDRDFEIQFEQMMKDRLREVQANRGAVVGSAPCETSNDKSQAGCGGGCEWCTEVKKARQRGKKIEGAGNRSGVHSQKFELV